MREPGGVAGPPRPPHVLGIQLQPDLDQADHRNSGVKITKYQVAEVDGVPGEAVHVQHQAVVLAADAAVDPGGFPVLVDLPGDSLHSGWAWRQFTNQVAHKLVQSWNT